MLHTLYAKQYVTVSICHMSLVLDLILIYQRLLNYEQEDSCIWYKEFMQRLKMSFRQDIHLISTSFRVSAIKIIVT